MRSWTDKHRDWVMQLKFEQRALEDTLTDYAAEGTISASASRAWSAP